MFKKICIIGCGLIGSSLARAIKKNNLAEKIVSSNRSDAVNKKVIELKIVDDSSSDTKKMADGSDLVVIAGEYEGKMQAESVWLTETSRISGEVHYKSLQMDRGAALNCRVVHNWNETDNQKAEEIEEQADEATEEQIDEK